MFLERNVFCANRCLALFIFVHSCLISNILSLFDILKSGQFNNHIDTYTLHNLVSVDVVVDDYLVLILIYFVGAHDKNLMNISDSFLLQNVFMIIYDNIRNQAEAELSRCWN